MKKILLFIVVCVACSYSAFSQSVYFTDQVTNSSKTTLTASVYCSEAVTVVFEAITACQNTNRDCNATYKVINYSNYIYDYLPTGTPSSRKTMTVDLPQGKSSVELTAYNASAVLVVSTVNGKTYSTMPLTLYHTN
ncbi:MAG: hypothetical protein LIP08_13300 [Bacteroides sp.]|nr:hypothetical protein [Bacteroides sp.]